ncbi:hypothetical protein niasHS_015030 [Heterodera schachtii]|uniref:Major facilitator superfamily (MFS) profile domain-containing protein n=2 Tax=Heterodera TaxID=34509 RepID=A0ABD2I9K1_HETSC
MSNNLADKISGEERPKEATETKPLLSDGTAGEGIHGQSQRDGTAKADLVNDAERTEEDERKDGDLKLDDCFRMGWYMLIVCTLSQLLLFVEVGDLLFMTFAGAEPTVEKCGTLDFSLMNQSLTAKKRCEWLENLWKNETESEKWHCYNDSITEKELTFQFKSVNVQFEGLFCKRTELKLSQSLQLVGIIPGSFVFGWLSDLYGRRLTMLSALVLWVFAMLATSFSASLVIFTVLRFVVCFFNAGIAVTLIVFTSELYPKKHRFCLMNLITWAPNYILFGILASFIPNWQHLQRVLALFALPCMGLILFLSESPRFLISARKMKEAKEAIIRMHKFDGRPYDEKALDALLEKELQQMLELSVTKKKYNYLHLFYNTKFTMYTLSVSFSLFVVTLITYALVYNIEKMSGNIFLNMIWMGMFKYTMNLAIAFADLKFKWLGRKLSHLLSEVLVLAALGLFVTLRLTGFDANFTFLSNGALVAAVGFCGILFNSDKLAGSELFPTGVRNLSCSFGQICSRIGVVGAPMLFFLDVCDHRYCSVFPHFTMIALALIDAIFFQFVVRETKGRPMLTEFPRN